MTSGHHQRARPRPSRRAVVRGAAWSVPVVAAATAAPAFAASTCSPVTFDFNGYPAGTHVASGTSAVFGGVTVQLTYTGPSSGTANNANIFATTQTSNELRFYDANTPSTNQVISFTFNKPVKNVQLSIIDIDQSSNYDDRLVVTTAGFSAAKGADVTGAGGASGNTATTGPFRSRTGVAVPDGSAAATLNLTWASQLSFVSFTYQQGPGTTTGTPHIGVKSIAFTPVTC
jgi:hypothetical protein